MSAGYSAVQTAGLVSALRWACGRLSEILAVWAGDAAAAGGNHQAAVGLSVLGRRLASHRQALDGLQPDSELLAQWRQPAPGDASLAEALDEIAALDGAAERLAVAREVLVPQLLGAYRDVCEHAAPHCDAALASTADSLHRDLGGDLGGGLGGGRTAGILEGAAPTGAAAEAERGLSAVGGLVARSLVRPDGWV